MSLIENYDNVIIGYGVSGLCAASILKGNNLVVEEGKDVSKRNHSESMEAMIGCGGAGLFSDGKFSFYPAGTRVWGLEEKSLKSAYNSIVEILKEFIDVPSFPVVSKTVDNPSNKWILKKYYSKYIDFNSRLKIIEILKSQFKGKILFEHKISWFDKLNDVYYVKIENQSGHSYVRAKRIIIAGGRFYPTSLSRICGIIPMKFRRIEYGLRVETDSNNTDMSYDEVLDPKFIFNGEIFQSRTFCWCRNGETVLTKSGSGLQTYSGRSDITNTGRTNFGLNIKITSEMEMRKLMEIKPFKMKFNEIEKSKFDDIYGLIYGDFLWNAYQKLIDKFPSFKTDQSLTLLGPTIEGVGFYPDIDEKTLKVKGHDIYCIGDASGIFRGIVPSMISGFFIGYLLNSN